MTHGQKRVISPTPFPAWQANSVEAELSSQNYPHNWENNYRPPGGFVSYIKNQFPFGHHVSEQPTPDSATQSQPSINVDNVHDDGEHRSDKLLNWTLEEDQRLMSAWLNNSNDSIMGNNKKNDQYWGDVTAAYNKTTPKNRHHLPKQAKDRWHKLNKLVNQFHCSWMKVYRVYSSGQSDDQLMRKAHEMFTKDYGGHFVQVSTWLAVRDQPKWQSYNKNLSEEKKRKLPDTGEPSGTPCAIDLEDIPRPKGNKAAKAERNAKGKEKGKTADLEELDKFLNMQTETNKNRNGIMEMQVKISAEKLESAKLAHLTSQENKEAKKLEKEAKMLETYMTLVTHDTSTISDEVKAEHLKAIKFLSLKLFGKVD